MGIINSHPARFFKKSLLAPKGATEGDHLEFYVGLLRATIRDVASVCYQSDVGLTRDIQEIEHRVKHEGMSFLTRTLPSLGRAIDLALATDTSLKISGFKLTRKSKIPLFLSGVLTLVFDADGNERSDASIQAVKCLRQLCYLFYKLELPPTDKQNDNVIKSFIETDTLLPLDFGGADDRVVLLLQEAKKLISRILGPVSPTDARLFKPRHGPGSVATGEKAFEKPVFKRFYRALALQFPYEDWFFYNASHLCDDLAQFMNLEELGAGTAKVVLVPKDSRGPRLISCEPLEYQWIQQGLMNTMVKTIESHPLTKGRVNFTDQTVNQRLSLDGSLNNEWSTLDMKEASDRVSLALVKELFPPLWYASLTAARTEATMLPDGTVLKLNKFAPMGSAVCFPVESLIFWALSVCAISYGKGRSCRREAIRSVFVYGDDIICSTKDQSTIRQTLPLFGLLFNESKCCIGKSFRESCGVDAFRGVDVTPLKLRSIWCFSLSGSDYASWVAYCNSFCSRGLFNACDYLAGFIQRVRRTPYADHHGSQVVALVDCRKMAIHANAQIGIKTRMHGSSDPRRPQYQYYQAKGWVVTSRSLKGATVPGWAEMQRVASYWALDETKGPDYVDRVGRRCLAPAVRQQFPDDLSSYVVGGAVVTAYQYTLPRQVTLKRGWRGI